MPCPAIQNWRQSCAANVRFASVGEVATERRVWPDERLQPFSAVGIRETEVAAPELGTERNLS